MISLVKIRNIICHAPFFALNFKNQKKTFNFSISQLKRHDNEIHRIIIVFTTISKTRMHQTLDKFYNIEVEKRVLMNVV